MIKRSITVAVVLLLLIPLKILMPDPFNPISSPSLKPQKVKEKVINDFINVVYTNQNKSRNMYLERIIHETKSSPVAEGIKENTQVHSSVQSQTNKSDTCPKIEKKFQNPIEKKLQNPSVLSKLKVLFLSGRLPSFLGSKMSDKKPGRPMKYPYTFSAKLAQFPLKFHINNNWMWKYYFIAVAFSFPVFYKLGRLSNSPENVKTWEEIRKRDFTPGGHH